MKDDENTHRLFFALWPNESVRKSIVETLSQLTTQESRLTSEGTQVQGRVMRPQNLHITLHFIGQVTTQTRDCMHRAAQALSPALTQNATSASKVNSFCLALDCFGHFPGAKVFWMGAQDIPTELINLQRQLGDVLKNCGYSGENRNYQPHVTLMRKYNQQYDNSQLWNRSTQAEFSIPWQVDEFVLVESVQAELLPAEFRSSLRSEGGGVNYQVIEKYPLS